MSIMAELGTVYGSQATLGTGFYTKASVSICWFQEHAELSLRLIHNTGLSKEAAIIEVGGGTSTLVDDLVAEGYTDLTVLDLSSSAISVAKQRLGKHAEAVNWMVGDITLAEFPVHRFDIWHDRAVFHFITIPHDHHAYVERVMRAVRPGGHVIITAVAKDSPEQVQWPPRDQIST